MNKNSHRFNINIIGFGDCKEKLRVSANKTAENIKYAIFLFFTSS